MWGVVAAVVEECSFSHRKALLSGPIRWLWDLVGREVRRYQWPLTRRGRWDPVPGLGPTRHSVAVVVEGSESPGPLAVLEVAAAEIRTPLVALGWLVRGMQVAPQ